MTDAATGTRIEGSWNFRDVGHAGAVRTGRLFRSSELCGLTAEGRAALHCLGVTDVADLRSVTEVRDHGASAVGDAVIVHPLALDGDRAAPHEQALQRMLAQRPQDGDPVAMARALMLQEYDRLARLPGTGEAVRYALRVLAEGGRLLVSCFAGKDRTGIVVALVLEAIGVGDGPILDDYLLSNAAAPDLRASIVGGVRRRYGEVTPHLIEYIEGRLTDDVLGVDAAYLRAAREAVDDRYGSLTALLERAGVSQALLDRVRGELAV